MNTHTHDVDRPDTRSGSRFAGQPFIDGHLDLAYLAEDGRDLTAPAETAGGVHVPGAVSFPSLREGNITTAIGTIFIASRTPADPHSATAAWCFDTPDEAYACCVRQISWYQRWHSAKHIRLYPQAENGAPLKVILMLEGAAGVRDVNDLRAFYLAGVALISLTWNEGTKYAGGDQSGGPLTAEGRALVAEIDKLNFIHDVSHLSEQAFWAVLSEARRPKVATHSNCRVLLPGKQHPERHLSDAQIRALTSQNTIIGINLFSRFLAVDRRATIADVVWHVEHIAQLTGTVQHVALGSDMDGGFNRDLLPEGLDHPRYLYRLLDALSAAGFSDGDIRRFAFDNWNDFLTAYLTPTAPL